MTTPEATPWGDLRRAAEALAIQPHHRFRWNGHHLPSVAANSFCIECGETKADIAAIRSAYEKAIRDPRVVLELLAALESQP